MKLFVDARDEKTARLLDAESRAATIPSAWLPADVREGDWIDVQMKRTKAPDDSGRRATLSAGDDGQDIKL